MSPSIKRRRIGSRYGIRSAYVKPRMRIDRSAVTLAYMSSTIESPEPEVLPDWTALLLGEDEEEDDVDGPSVWLDGDVEPPTDGVFPGVPLS